MWLMSTGEALAFGRGRGPDGLGIGGRMSQRRPRRRVFNPDPGSFVRGRYQAGRGLSLAVSLPTMLVGFTRYSMDDSFSVLGRNKLFLLVMAAGSIVGTFIGGQLLGLVPKYILLPVLAALLLLSAIKVWRHE